MPRSRYTTEVFTTACAVFKPDLRLGTVEEVEEVITVAVTVEEVEEGATRDISHMSTRRLTDRKSATSASPLGTISLVVICSNR